MTHQRLPRVSFIIPVRDDARRLDNCLRSIAANRYPRELVEILVVDNGSSDDSGLVARRSGAAVLDLRGVVAELRNAGAARATGDILAFVDADHQLDPEWLAALADCMGTPAIAAAGAPYSAPPQGTWVQRCYDGLRERRAGRQDVEWLASGNMAIRREAFEELGGFDIVLATCEDVDLCQRLHARGSRIVSDERLKSVHLGDPATLKGLFMGELWRGRDNLRASLRGPKDFRHLRSAMIPILYLAALTALGGGIASLSGRGGIVALLGAATLGALSGIRARYMVRRSRVSTLVHVVQTFAVAVVYDAARALALVVRVDHRTRRFAEVSSHVQTQ